MKAVSVLLCLALAHGIAASIFKQQDRDVDDLDVRRLDYVNQYQRQHRNQPSESDEKRNHHRKQHRDNKPDQQPGQQPNQEADQQPGQQPNQQPDQQRDQRYEQQYKQQHEQQPDQQRNQQRNQHHKNQQEEQRVQHREQQRFQHRDHERDQQRDHQRDHERKHERDYQSEKQPQNEQWGQTTEDKKQSQQYQPEEYQQYHRDQYQSSSAQHSQEQDKDQYPNYKRSQRSHQKKKSQRHSSSSSSESSQSSEESKERRQYSDNEKSTPRSQNQKRESPLKIFDKNQDKLRAHADAIEWKALQMTVDELGKDKEEIRKIFGDAQKAMKHISEEDKAKFHQAYSLAKQHDNEDVVLNATQLAQKHNYPVEEHTIKTDDGYVLTVFRIPPKKHIRDVQKKPVVFLMHGVLGSADDWLLMGPKKSLAYLLSDAGYDVWLGNARGNKYSKDHVSKHPAVSDFWQYSNDDIALHDLPAMIDYALETTKQEKLYYIGHSQGTTAFFALTATRPEYNDKIIMMYALSPMVYMTNVRSPLFRMIAPTSKFHETLEQLFGKGAFTPNKELIRTVGGSMLEKEIGCEKVSSNVNFVMAGVNVGGLDSEIIPMVMRHLPAGTSTKVIKHYGQGVASDNFRKYDYGVKTNEKVYGKEQPPKYDIEKVQAPVTLYYSEEDWLAHPKDVERLEKELPNVRETHKVPDEHFSHMDFQFSTKAPEMVYRRIIESMENNQ